MQGDVVCSGFICSFCASAHVSDSEYIPAPKLMLIRIHAARDFGTEKLFELTYQVSMFDVCSATE